MNRFFIIIPILIVLFSCSTKKEDIELFPLAELSKLPVYKDIDQLPSRFDSVYRLDLSGKQLTQLPKIIFKLTNLQELNISKNQLSDLKGISVIKNLQKLNIGVNNFCSFPDELTDLKNLKILALWWNDIKTFPSDFFENNTEIEELDMTSLFEFDFETNLAKIHRFKNLKQLNLGNNQIPNLTIQFDKIDNLEVFGYIRQNSIDIKDLCLKLSSCSKLKTVHFSANNITELPNEIVLLESLEELNLFENKIRTIPAEIVKMRNLKKITLSDNPIDIIKIKDIEKRMPQTIFIYNE